MSPPNHDVIAPLEARIRAMLAQIRRPSPSFRLAQTPQDDGTPHIEISDDGLAWIRTERGVELERQAATEDDVLFLVMDWLTRDYAHQAELQARGEDNFSRWRWMEAHIRLMAHLDLTWGARLSERYEATLKSQPLSPAELHTAQELLDLSSFGVD